MQKKTVEIDYLTEDVPIPGQEWGVYSFLSPEHVRGVDKNTRAFKNRGNFGSQLEADQYAENLRKNEPAFHIFVGENFKWCAFDPDPEKIKDNRYYEPKLQELMKGTLESHDQSRRVEAERKRNMIEESINQQINPPTISRDKKVRDRLRKKLEKRQKEMAKHEQTDDDMLEETKKLLAEADKTSAKTNAMDTKTTDARTKELQTKSIDDSLAKLKQELEKMKSSKASS